MLLLLFELGSDRYAVDVRQVAEILPMVALTRLPQALGAIAGLLNCRGVPVPVLDLSLLILGRPAERRLSTRIVLVHYRATDGSQHLLGLVAEKATRTVRREPSEFVASGVTATGVPYLGPVATDAQGLLQWVDVQSLLPPAIRDVLFTPTEEDECRSTTLRIS